MFKFLIASPSGSRITLALLVASIFLGLTLTKTERAVRADVQVNSIPRSVRVAHLDADPVPGRLDYIFLEKSQGSNPIIEAYAPGGSLLFSIPPDPNEACNEILDVVDLKGDGHNEIVGISRGNNAGYPALWVFDGYGNVMFQQTFNALGTGLGLNATEVKIYDVLPLGSGQKRIAVIPDTFLTQPTHTDSAAYFFSFDSGGGHLIASPGIHQNDQGAPGQHEIAAFPGVCAGDVNNVGVNNIVAVCKSRILIYDQDGGIVSYNQFVDSSGTFTNYGNANADKAQDGVHTWEGRRYGLFKLIDIDGDGKLELICAGDWISYTDGVIIPGAVYTAFKVSSAVNMAYLPHIWQTEIPHSDIAFGPNISNLPANYSITQDHHVTPQPGSYLLGVPLNGIVDVNGDGIPDIVVNEWDGRASGSAWVDVINARTGVETPNVLPGLCIDVRFVNAPTQLRPDLVVYNPATNPGSHSIWRFGFGTYTPAQDSGVSIPPGQTRFPTVSQTTYDRLNLSGPYAGIGETDDHFSLQLTTSGGTSAIVGYNTPDPLNSFALSASPPGLL